MLDRGTLISQDGFLKLNENAKLNSTVKLSSKGDDACRIVKMFILFQAIVDV